MNDAERLEAAILAMEDGLWTSAIAQLITLTTASHPPATEVSIRLLLAQALHEDGQQDMAMQQAHQAQQLAVTLGDRGLTWKAMALLESMRIIAHGQL